jgi:hypothetical protein
MTTKDLLIAALKDAQESSTTGEKMRAIAYSMDTLVPGFYFWIGSFAVRIGGCKPDDQPNRYPGQLNSSAGLALVLPGYKIWTTYKRSYDPGQASN